MPPPATRELERRASRTAEINAVERAAERSFPTARRLLDDPFASIFVERAPYRAIVKVPPLGRAALRYLDRRFPGLHAEILLRARFADHQLSIELERGLEQLVLLGAGYDSTALRHDLDSVQVFEVDAPTTQRAKRERLARHGLESRSRFVPCDFERDRPARLLETAGLNPSRRTLTVWLGVSYYLERDSFRAALADIGAFTAPGGKLVWDYMDPEVIEGTTDHEGARRCAEWVRKRGEPYRLGMMPQEASAELRVAGFRAVEHLRVPELAARFAPGAWCEVDSFMGVVAAEREGS